MDVSYMHLWQTVSENQDKMPHNGAFYQDLLCLLRQIISSEKEMQFYLEIITCDLSICTMNHAKFLMSNQKEESISK